MAKLGHLDEALVDKIAERLWNVQGTLNGLGALFKTGSELSLNADESFGIGQCLQAISTELAELEGLLKHGHQTEGQSD